MKKYLFRIILIFVVSVNVNASEKLNLKMITKRVLDNNLLVLENAEKVYQAKISISEARLSMLPKLNLWNLGKVAIDPTAFLDVAQEIAPFLVPSNWFRMKETEYLYMAEKYGMASLQANEVFHARGIYYNLILDLELLNSLEKYEKELGDLVLIAEDRYDLGLERIEFVRMTKIQHINLLEDVSNMKQLIAFEKNALLSAISLSLDTEVDVEKFEDNIFNKNVINPKEWEDKILLMSPELKQIDKFIEVIPLLKKEVKFSLLGVPSISRGTSGGFFDDVPESSGLGFSTGKQIEIVESKRDILFLQRRGVEETLKRQLYNLSVEYNSNQKIMVLQKERYQLSNENFNSIKEKLTVGADIELSELNQGIDTLLQSFAIYLKSIIGQSSLNDKLSRLTFNDDYSLILNNLSEVKNDNNKNCRKTIFGKKKCK
jgi:hypothetical protein